MSGGLLALLDDVAALTKLAAAQIDDVAAQAAKASTKAAGVVIDDSAVTPKYVVGLPAARELPIVWQIARASLFNKLVILLPAALLLNTFAPWLLTPLLMIGGCYLCYEGAEKVWHVFAAKHDASEAQKRAYEGGEGAPIDAAHLEKTRVAGAIKTDFVLSAEIMAIALSAIETDNLVTLAITLAVVAVGITAVVYGAVALFVKADDIGLKMSQVGRLSVTRALGRGIVKSMPTVLAIVSAIGTAAMLWVGGNILTHGLAGLGYPAIEQAIYAAGEAVAGGLPKTVVGFGKWFVRAAIDGVIGLGVGLILIPIVAVTIAALFRAFGGSKSGAH
jgi:predicted DNA repair protein MutK